MDDLWQYLSWAEDSARMFTLRDYADAVIVGVLCVIGIDALITKIKKSRGKTKMPPKNSKERDRYAQRCAVDILVDGLELFVIEGFLTRYDVNKLYAKIGRGMGWTDLSPSEVQKPRRYLPPILMETLRKSRRWGYRKPKKGVKAARKRSSEFKTAT